MTPPSPNERGLLSTELALIMPIMFIFALLGIFFVQAERHQSRAQQAADAAARAASLERTPAEARVSAQSAAQAVCEGTVVIQDAEFRYQAPAANSFTPGHVTLTLTCSEEFSAFGRLLGNTTRTEGGAAVAVIEYWRSDG